MAPNYSAADLAGFSAFFGMLSCILLVCAIITIVALWKVFVKAEKPGWHAIIPFLNQYDLFDISWNPKYGLMFLGSLAVEIILSAITSGMSGIAATILSIIVSICALFAVILSFVMYYKLSKAFGYGIGCTLGLIFFYPIALLIIAFGRSEYLGRQDD